METCFTDSHFVQSDGVIYELHPQIEAELIEAFDKIKGAGSSAELIAARCKALSSTIPALARAISAAAPSETDCASQRCPVLPADARIKALEDQLKIVQDQVKQENDRRAQSR
ncbi:MAG: hypothetical protein JWL59_4666 [Chthoniobacteraceae bacterium]|nr:hypothetical protein [Chthoniobacteraceae bacterium]